ncbi:hypothetical protein GBA65_18270 [Rubrobacter marinus]|uniref:Uncharacterized protein n=1 Tax=Rubrobacter marinus TaxID=2653852 RepID=A0A6G8Q0Y8_9ACTN|nr:hypothetical protein [Rubrobacter marinus]QIN80141.1 hypothetical protein GBA65_18270 [Rubrobacter marinus]
MRRAKRAANIPATMKLPHETGLANPTTCPCVTAKSASPAENASESPPGTSKRRKAATKPAGFSGPPPAVPGMAWRAPGMRSTAGIRVR